MSDREQTPWTLKEQVVFHSAITRHNVRAFFREGMWQKVAHRLPRRLVYFVAIRAYAEAWERTNKGPDDLLYAEVIDPFALPLPWK